MSTTKIKTAVAAPEEPQLQPGDLVTTVRPTGLWFGRVFDVSESTLRIWWNGLAGLPAQGGLVTHQTSDVAFVERPRQYLAVLFETAEGDTYGFVTAGDDVTAEERAFDVVPRYTIVSRRTTQTTTGTNADEDGSDDATFDTTQ